MNNQPKPAINLLSHVEAAAMLNVSVEFLTRLCGDNVLRVHASKAGFREQDIVTYKHQRDQERTAALDEWAPTDARNGRLRRSLSAKPRWS